MALRQRRWLSLVVGVELLTLVVGFLAFLFMAP
jgi:hypothetical protein